MKSESVSATANYREESYIHISHRLRTDWERKGRMMFFLNNSDWFGFPCLSHQWKLARLQLYTHSLSLTLSSVMSHYYLPPEHHVLQNKSTGWQLESPWLMSSKSVWRDPTQMKAALSSAWMRPMALKFYSAYKKLVQSCTHWFVFVSGNK